VDSGVSLKMAIRKAQMYKEIVVVVFLNLAKAYDMLWLMIFTQIVLQKRGKKEMCVVKSLQGAVN